MKEKQVKISRATVYRTLELLVKSGMVRRVHLGEDHYHYEHVRGDSHHDHLICTTCGGVIEFHDEELEQRQREICERRKFTPTFHNLQILGVCDASLSRDQKVQVAAVILAAYRWQYIVSGVQEPRFVKALGSMITTSQSARIGEALAPIM